jgi:uncharacterized protein YcfJ
MNTKPVVAALLVALSAQPALADRYKGYYSPRPAYGTVRVANTRYAEPGVVYARVLGVDPIVRHVTVTTPREECWDETVYREKPKGTGAIIAGGILGGIFGHQFGSGHGNDAATVAGAVVGSAVANHVVQTNYEAYPQTVQRCETHSEVHEEERIEGYNVTYEYGGQRYMTRTREDPGNEIAVRVSVRPVGS